MFTVECPGCKASYQVDERRVPATGLRMRCPKCSTAFVVEKPESSSVSDTASRAGDLPAPVVPSPVAAPRRAPPRQPPKFVQPAPPLAAPAPAAPRAPRPAPRALSRTDEHGASGLPATRTDEHEHEHGAVGLPATRTDEHGAVGLPATGTNKGTLPGFGGKPAPEVPQRGIPPRPGIPPKREPGRNVDDGLLPQALPPQPRPAAPAQRPPIPVGGAVTTAQRPSPRTGSARKTGAEFVDPDLPELVAGAALPAHPVANRPDADRPNVRVPSEPPLGLESDLPAAFGPRQPGGAGRALSPSHLDSFPGLEVGLGLESDLPDRLAAELPGAALPELARPVRSSEPGLDLDLDLPAPSRDDILPAMSIGSNPPAEVDDFEFQLPSPMESQQNYPDLISNRGGAQSRGGTLPGGFELPDLEAELPRARPEGIGLPSLPGQAGASKRTLPGSGPPGAPDATVSGQTPVLAAPMEVDLGLDFALDMGQGAHDPGPGARSDLGPSLPPALGGPSNRPSDAEFDISMGDLELPVNPSSFPPKRPAISSSPPVSRSGGAGIGIGGTDYGEVSLESSDHELAVETEGDSPRRSLTGEALEFGAVPQAPETPAEAPPLGGVVAETSLPVMGSAKGGRSVDRSAFSKPASKRPRLIAAAVTTALVLTGSGLTLLPDIGPFGAHFIADQLGRQENEALIQQQVNAGRRVLLNDDFSGVPKTLASLEVAQRDHERLRALKAYAACFAYVVDLRYGHQPQSRARAKVALDELGARNDLKYFRLAAAARAAVEGNLAKARSAIDAETSREPRDAEAQAISAEIALLEHRSADALRNWQLVAKLEPSARSDFGVARAQFALGQFDAAVAEAERAIAKNASHVGARLLLARIALAKPGNVEPAERRIGEALALQAQQSTADFVLGKTLMGDVHLLRSRISLAEAVYQEALAKDPRSAPALRGLGETLYRAGRYSESLARFEAGLQADPDDVLMAVGAARAQLALERIREAGALLGRLRQANPKNYAVNYWHGRAEEAAGNRDEAEKAYAAAIEVGGTDPVVVDAYVAMALLKNQQGRREEAQKVLTAAQEKLPRMPKIHEAMGQLALAEGRYAAAVQNFNLAMSLDPSDLGIKFRLGVALRKNREFDAATRVFDEVTAADRDYPGLALERGQLYEASGQTEEALRAFESALAKAPADPDLMLRVGCGKVAAGQAQQAEQLLKKVLQQRPTSAETHHCLGRAQLLEGSNLALALRTLERAVELDPHRAEYHLYVGWAANEAGRVALAEQAFKKALELDQGLGDAYWQRGILRYRQGAVKDAVADLTRALELRPGRYEAHAALADAYFDLGLEAKALEQWRFATKAQPDNATWRYRFGKLLQAAHRDADAKPELEVSLELAAKLPTMPRWAWEAHHLLARAIGLHPSAVKHWQAFLELAPRDNVYREEAKQMLAKLGHPWTGE